MQYEVVFAGFGGQGVLAIGQIFALAAMEAGHHVVWLPSYGPEMRGGTANCTVVLSDHPVGSPVVDAPSCAVVMNRPSLEKFAARVRPGGLLIINSSLITVAPTRTDFDIVTIPANDIANRAGNSRAPNMAILGAFVGRSGVLTAEVVRAAIETKLGNKKGALESNLAVFDEGYRLAKAA